MHNIFLHSSFRTGSTWLWSKFRQNRDCYCYYEVFNELLAHVDFKSISSSAADWNSHHPPGPPYFVEFCSLIMDRNGIKNFDSSMPIQDFFLDIVRDDIRSEHLRNYLVTLINLAVTNGKTPVLSCTRSIGRVQTIRSQIGGKHILIKRGLLKQWFSYSNQFATNNPYFFKTIIETIRAPTSEPFIIIVRQLISDITISNHMSDDTHDTMLIAFLALHIYLYARHHDDFDLVLAFNSETSGEDLRSSAHDINKITGIEVDLSDYKEKISAPLRLIRSPDRVYSMVRALFVKGIIGLENNYLRDFVDKEISIFQEDYEQYYRIARSAHILLDSALALQEKIEIEQIATAKQIEKFNLASDATAENSAQELQHNLEDSMCHHSSDVDIAEDDPKLTGCIEKIITESPDTIPQIGDDRDAIQSHCHIIKDNTEDTDTLQNHVDYKNINLMGSSKISKDTTVIYGDRVKISNQLDINAKLPVEDLVEIDKELPIERQAGNKSISRRANKKKIVRDN